MIAAGAFSTAIYIGALLFLLGGGIWIGLALLCVGYIGIELFTPRPAGSAMATIVWSSLSSWNLVALPLFIWMGEILTRSNMSHRLFEGLKPIVKYLPGSLVHVNVIGCTLFAAISGSSAATVSTVGKISLPELKKRAYPDSISIGTLAGSGTLGLLMPPSIILIVYGVATNESITKLFMAGIIPALLLASFFVLYVALWFVVKGRSLETVPNSQIEESHLTSTLALLPLALLISIVLGSMYIGLLTATEAAVAGVLGALIISHFDGTLSISGFLDGLRGALKTSCMIGLILAGSATVTLSLGYTGIPRAIAETISTLNLTTAELLLILGIFYLVLGMFVDGISAVVLTMAIVEPMVRQAGIDLIWFGIFLVILVETAQITPPVGFNLFILQSLTKHNIAYIARVSSPQFLIMIFMLFVIWLFPGIVLYLPNMH